jgi:DNA repair ATPase RecN
LGSVVQKNGKTQNKINERIGKASEFYNLMKSLIQIKIQIENVKLRYSMRILDRHLHGAEIRRCSKREESKQQAAEMKCLYFFHPIQMFDPSKYMSLLYLAFTQHCVVC